MFDEIFLFINLVECGNMSKTARVLGVHQTTISRKIEALENKLKFKLLQTTSLGKIKLTAEGQYLYDNSISNFEDIHSTIESIYNRSSSLSGDFHIVIPAIITLKLGNILSQFAKNNPNVNMRISDFNGDVAAYGLPFDVALSFAMPSNPDYMVHSIHKLPISFCASTEYVKTHGQPTCLEDLKHHQVLSLQTKHINHKTNFLTWTALNTKTNKIETVTFKKSKASFDSAIAGKLLLMSNQGITALPDVMLQQELKENTVVKILPNYELPPLQVHLKTR